MRALWSDRPNCSHNVFQKVKRTKRFSDIWPPRLHAEDHTPPEDVRTQKLESVLRQSCWLCSCFCCFVLFGCVVTVLCLWSSQNIGEKSAHFQFGRHQCGHASRFSFRQKSVEMVVEIVFEIAAFAGAKLWKMAGDKLLGSWTGLNIFRGRFGVFFELFVSLYSEIPRRGRSRGGRCANLSQIARQICAKLLVFPNRCVHQRKGARNCRKFVAKSRINFGQFYASTWGGFKKALLQNPRKMIRGRIFNEMIRISARKSELGWGCHQPLVVVHNGVAHVQTTNTPGWVYGKKEAFLRTRSTTTRDRNLQFRGTFSTGCFFEFSPVDFLPSSPGFLCNLEWKSPPKYGENCPISKRRKMRKILSRLWLSWFFRSLFSQEDVNGEKLTVKKWWIFGADFSRFMQSFSRFIRDINGEKKNLVIDDLFHG